MKRREHQDYLQDIFESLSALEEFVEGMKFEYFQNDKRTIFAAIRCFEVIGEAAKKIPASIRNKRPEIPWKEMAGMRDKLIHEYFGFDINVLWKTIQKDITPLRIAISKLLQEAKDKK